MRFHLSIFLLLVLCSCANRKNRQVSRQQIRPQLMHPLFFQDEIASRISFPFWFNDSILRKHRIRSITIRSFRIDGETDELLYEREFLFSSTGRLSQISRKEFMDDIAISDKRYSYFKAAPGIFQPMTIITDSSGMNKNNTYRIHSHISSRPDISVYLDNTTRTRIHFLPNPKKQGALSVDSVSHPDPADWVILGTPMRPTKRYHVSNVVNESEVIEYKYKTQNFPQQIEWNDFPFRQKRYFHYRNGSFSGFTDYSLIDNKTISRTNTALFYADGRPILLKKYRYVNGESEVLQKDQILYTFF